MLNIKIMIMLVINRATEIVTKGLKKSLEVVPGKHSIDSPQKIAVLGTSPMFRKEKSVPSLRVKQSRLTLEDGAYRSSRNDGNSTNLRCVLSYEKISVTRTILTALRSLCALYHI
jgi:hypothetical protein